MSILDQAKNLTENDRQKTYGPPSRNFKTAYSLGHAVLASSLDPALKHALYMIQTKVARLLESPDHLDSVVDIAGYANTYAMILEEKSKSNITINRLAGGSPKDLGVFNLAWDEQWSMMYMPVSIDAGKTIAIPDSFARFSDLVEAAMADYDKPYKYIYLTVKNKYAKAGEYQNREGVHVDGYLTDDENYVYVSGEPTEFIHYHEFEGPENDAESLIEFEKLWEVAKSKHGLQLMEPNHLYRLGKTLHRSPEIKKSHTRLFVKVSFSNDKFNLKGNAKNRLLSYNWKMYDRGAIRNSPSHSNADSVKEGQK